MFHPLCRHSAQSAVLLLPVLQQHITRWQVGGIEVVEQEVSFGVYRHFRHIIAADRPLAHKAHSTNLSVHFLKAHDVLTPATQKGGQRLAIIAHKARQRTYIYVATRVLPHRLRLHLRQAVERGEAAVTQMVRQQFVVGMTAERDGTEQCHEEKCPLVHRLQIYAFSFKLPSLCVASASLFSFRHAKRHFRHSQHLFRQKVHGTRSEFSEFPVIL